VLRVADHYAGTDTGRQRRANEDSLLARSPLFVVADGMGGAQAGEVASRIAVDSFRHGLDDASQPESALATLALAANSRIHELSHSNAEHAGMGTTLTAVYVGDQEVAIAHVGDSRAYCLRDGELLRLTDDHSLVDELMRQGRLTPEEAVEHPQRSVITRALGPEGTVEVDTRTFRARPGDVYLLCSDGLTTMLAEEEIAEMLRAHPRLRDAGEALIAAANEAGAAAASRRRRVRRAGALAGVLIVLALIGSGAYLALQSVYFIGTNNRGLVTLYQGVPFQLPGNLALYSSRYVSGVSASTLTPQRRQTLLDHSLRSESNAAGLLRSLELGQLE
jgi:serine/threonine protein phosphatase PrpC